MQNQQQIQNDEIIEAVEIPRFIKQMVAYVTSGRNQIDNISDGVQKTFDFKVVYLASICGVGAVMFLAYNANKMPMFTSKIVMPKAAVTTTATPKKVVKTEVIEGFDGLEGIIDNTSGRTVAGKVAQQQQFIAKYSKVAIAEMDKFGIPASITMAQAILESDAGDSKLTETNKNHFGLKCFSKTCPTGHCTEITTIHNGDHHKDHYLKFADEVDSWRAHSNFLKQPRYANCFKLGKNYKAWATALKNDGYAGDPNYDTKLIYLIEKFELNKLDDL